MVVGIVGKKFVPYVLYICICSNIMFEVVAHLIRQARSNNLPIKGHLIKFNQIKHIATQILISFLRNFNAIWW